MRPDCWLVAGLLVVGNQVIAQPARDELSLRLTVNDQTVTLADDVRNVLRRQADAVVRSCAYDGGDQDERVWRDATADASSIRLAYAMPITLRLPRRALVVSEATFSLSDATFMGQPVLHHDGDDARRQVRWDGNVRSSPSAMGWKC